MKRVTIYTDGACIGNPGPGGYGVVLMYGSHRRELYSGFERTTNNRMELMGPIVGLSALKEPCAVDLFSDSQYVVKAMTNGWPQKWQAKGWRRNRNQVALNDDLWATLLELCSKHQVSFHWVRGHAGNAENERCDQLALAAAQGTALSQDAGCGR